MPGSVKRAISLPKEQDQKLTEISRALGAPFSTLVQTAIRDFLQKEELNRWEAAYRDYYSSRSNAEETLGIARDFRKKSPRW